MKPPATLELAAARVVQLATPAAVAATLRRLHLIQIDTIHVVARSPYLVRGGAIRQLTRDHSVSRTAIRRSLPQPCKKRSVSSRDSSGCISA